jgi:hypothetical protein
MVTGDATHSMRSGQAGSTQNELMEKNEMMENAGKQKRAEP